MMLGLASISGSPGVTTLATLFAGLWPTERVMLIEADTSSVCLGPRFNTELKPSPSIVDLAAECRHGVDSEAVLRQTQRLSLGRGFDVIVGGDSPGATANALSGLTPRLGELSTVVGFDVLVDLGRVLTNSAGTQAVSQLDGLVIGLKPDFESAEPLLRRLGEFGALATPCVVVGIGVKSSETDLMVELDGELRARSEGRVVYGGSIAHDPKVAEAWNRRRQAKPRTLQASSMVRSARAVLAGITELSASHQSSGTS